jgi:hypothetical protein
MPTDIYLRPSNIARTEECPGWLQLCRELKIQNPGPSEDASQGTRCHKQTAHRLALALGVEPSDATEWLDDDEETDLVDKAFQHTCDLPRSHDAKILIERSLPIVRDGEPILPYNGTPDYVVLQDDDSIYPDILHDHKFGQEGPRPRELYIQMACYAVAIWNYRITRNQEPRDIEASYFMPRTGEQGKITFDCANRKRIIDELKNLVHITNNATDLCPGDGCKYCPAKTQCPALRELTVETASVPAQGMTLGQAIRLRGMKKDIEDVLSAAGTLIKDTLRAGGEVEGWELREKSAPVALATEKLSVLFGILMDFGITAGDIFSLLKGSRAKLEGSEKIIASIMHNKAIKTKKDAKTWLRDECEREGIYVHGAPREELRRVR